MQQIFVELYNYRPAWLALPDAAKKGFVEGVLKAVEDISGHGVEVIGWGMNDPDTDRRAAYDFFCVYRVPSVEFQRGFEANINASGWHDYFEQVNVSGAALSPRDLLAANIAGRKPEPQARRDPG